MFKKKAGYRKFFLNQMFRFFFLCSMNTIISITDCNQQIKKITDLGGL